MKRMILTVITFAVVAISTVSAAPTNATSGGWIGAMTDEYKRIDNQVQSGEKLAQKAKNATGGAKEPVKTSRKKDYNKIPTMPPKVVHAESDFVVAFSPRGQIEIIIINLIGKLNNNDELLINIYTFTSKKLATAVIKARDRGVSVRVVIDKSQESQEYSAIHMLAEANIDLKVDHLPKIAHNKYAIINNKALITGSYNWTESARTKNTENFLYGENVPEIAKAYAENWHNRYNQSRAYKDRRKKK